MVFSTQQMKQAQSMLHVQQQMRANSNENAAVGHYFNSSKKNPNPMMDRVLKWSIQSSAIFSHLSSGNSKAVLQAFWVLVPRKWESSV